MPVSDDFWSFFDEVAVPKGALRSQGFRRIFAHLDRIERPVGIVETGCVRNDRDWGDGYSTVVFAKYAETHPGSVVYSVDIDPAAVNLCRGLVGKEVRLNCGDSVGFLRSITNRPPADLSAIDLLYLDSLDVDYENPLPSAIHHLKELAAISPLLSADSLVVVDDSPLYCLAVRSAPDQLRLLGSPRIGGKGKLIAEYAAQIGAQQVFSDYQAGWTGLGRPAPAAI